MKELKINDKVYRVYEKKPELCFSEDGFGFNIKTGKEYKSDRVLVGKDCFMVKEIVNGLWSGGLRLKRVDPVEKGEKMTVFEILDKFGDQFSEGYKEALKHWNTGLKRNKETRELMSSKKTGSKNPNFKGWYVVDGIEYERAWEVAEKYGISAKTVMNRCKHGVKGWGFKKKDEKIK